MHVHAVHVFWVDCVRIVRGVAFVCLLNNVVDGRPMLGHPLGVVLDGSLLVIVITNMFTCLVLFWMGAS